MDIGLFAAPGAPRRTCGPEGIGHQQADELVEVFVVEFQGPEIDLIWPLSPAQQYLADPGDLKGHDAQIGVVSTQLAEKMQTERICASAEDRLQTALQDLDRI